MDTSGELNDHTVPATVAAVQLDYEYDAGDQRVIKTATDPLLVESHTLYIFDSLEIRRAPYAPQGMPPGPSDYDLTDTTAVPYLLANGVRLARVVAEDADVPGFEGGAGLGGQLHVFFELGDHLGSTSVVLDQGTSELVERSTYQAYGATEDDYRPGRWAEFREDYRFTGKEEDVEVGMTYFGKRFYNPLLGRWANADPLTVHALGADANAYAYVRALPLKNVDPLGLCDNANPCSGQGARGAGGNDDNVKAEPEKSIPESADRARRMNGGSRGQGHSLPQDPVAKERNASPANAAAKLFGTASDGIAAVAAAVGQFIESRKGHPAVRDNRIGPEGMQILTQVAFTRVLRSKGTKSAVCKQKPFKRGVMIEEMLGHNLPKTFKTIDRWDKKTGTATSIKSLDIDAKSYQDASALRDRVVGYVDKSPSLRGLR